MQFLYYKSLYIIIIIIRKYNYALNMTYLIQYPLPANHLLQKRYFYWLDDQWDYEIVIIHDFTPISDQWTVRNTIITTFIYLKTLINQCITIKNAILA